MDKPDICMAWPLHWRAWAERASKFNKRYASRLVLARAEPGPEAFLKKAFEETPNLIVYKFTLAKTILFESGAAKGVAVESGGLAYNMTANKEVIVSAGVVSTVVYLIVSS